MTLCACSEMTESVPGRGGPNREAQCYNCGSSGHWAVACPEPTRETPAGLAAWRNSSNVGQGGGKGYAYNGASKRSKGPIITKYTQPLPQPPFSSGVGPYPPHPPGAHQPLAPYSGPSRPFQPYGNSPPPLPAGYPPPAYPYHLNPPYAAPAHYGPPLHGRRGALGPPLVPPLPSVPFAPGRPSAHDYRLPLPPYAQPSPHAPPSHRHASAKHSPQRHVRLEAPSPKSAAAPSRLPASRISHPLPPKPPPSHDQFHPQRDHKRKFERQHHQDRRQKGFRSTPTQPPPYSSPHHNVCSLESSVDRPPPGVSPAHGDSDQREKASSPGETHPAPCSPKKETVLQEAVVPAKVRSRPDPDDDAVPPEPAAVLSAAVTTGKQTRPQSLDGSSQTSPEAAQKNVSSPREANSTGNDPDSAVPHGVSINSPPHSDDQEDGEVSSDEAEQSPTVDSRAPTGGGWKSPTFATDDRWRRTRERSDESNDDGTSPKRPQPDRPADEAKDTSHKDTGAKDLVWDSLDVPRQADRKRRASTVSRGSRHSSVSSSSSDLNSLEAELLGRPKNQRQPQPSPPSRQRLERRTPPKPKRRQNNTNSAYR